MPHGKIHLGIRLGGSRWNSSRKTLKMRNFVSITIGLAFGVIFAIFSLGLAGGGHGWVVVWPFGVLSVVLFPVSFYNMINYKCIKLIIFLAMGFLAILLNIALLITTRHELYIRSLVLPPFALPYVWWWLALWAFWQVPVCITVVVVAVENSRRKMHTRILTACLALCLVVCLSVTCVMIGAGFLRSVYIYLRQVPLEENVKELPDQKEREKGDNAKKMRKKRHNGHRLSPENGKPQWRSLPRRNIETPPLGKFQRTAPLRRYSSRRVHARPSVQSRRAMADTTEEPGGAIT